MTALTLYGVKTAATTIANAAQLLTVNGGTSTVISSLLGTATGWGEVWGQGNAAAWAAAGSQPAASGHGWLWDVTTLEGQTIAAGTWTVKILTALSLATSCVADMHIRAFVHTSGGTYTQIGSDLVLTAQTVNTTNATYTFSASLPSQAFNTGDKLYMDQTWNVTTNTSASGSTIKDHGGPSAGNGVVGQREIDTPGYAPTGGGPIPVSTLALMGVG